MYVYIVCICIFIYITEPQNGNIDDRYDFQLTFKKVEKIPQYSTSKNCQKFVFAICKLK